MARRGPRSIARCTCDPACSNTAGHRWSFPPCTGSSSSAAHRCRTRRGRTSAPHPRPNRCSWSQRPRSCHREIHPDAFSLPAKVCYGADHCSAPFASLIWINGDSLTIPRRIRSTCLSPTQMRGSPAVSRPAPMIVRPSASFNRKTGQPSCSTVIDTAAAPCFLRIASDARPLSAQISTEGSFLPLSYSVIAAAPFSRPSLIRVMP